MFKRLFSGTSAAVLSLSSLLSLGFTGVAHAATLTWDGEAGDGLFSTAANWSGDTVPVVGDSITLPAIDNNTHDLTNDLGVVAFAGLNIGTAGASSYTYYNLDTILFADGALIKNVGNAYVTMNDSITADGGLVFDGHPPITVDGVDITVNYTDATYLNRAQACYGGGGDAPTYTLSWVPSGTVTVGDGSYYYITGTESAIDVQSGGAIGVGSNYAGDITFEGGGSVQGNICGKSTSLSVSNDATLSGSITLSGGDIVYDIAAGKKLTLTGSLAGSGNKLKAILSSTGTFVNNASPNSSATPAGTAVVAQYEAEDVTDDKPTESLSVSSNQILTFDGTRQYVTVQANAVLKGTGTVVDNLYVADGGTIAPGHSPGCMSAGILNLYGEYQFELGGDTACTGYDQLKVTDTTGITVTIDDTTAVLTTSRYEDYTPTQGQVFTIIDNQGSEAVDGTFEGLVEGATFEQNGIVFKISYVGGDGNDVTLTVQNVPTTPDTGFALMSANPIATITLMAAAAGALFFAARKLQAQPARKTRR